MTDRQRAGIEEFFEKRVVSFGHHFNQGFVGGLGGLA